MPPQTPGVPPPASVPLLLLPGIVCDHAAWDPVVPALYIVANVAIAISMAVSELRICLTSVAVLLAGAPISLLFAMRNRAADS